MANKNGVEKEMSDLAESAKKAWEERRPSAPAEKTEKAKESEPRSAPRRTSQSINDEDRAAGEGMGQSKYGPPPSTGNAEDKKS
jgi:hypothetical protein